MSRKKVACIILLIVGATQFWAAAVCRSRAVIAPVVVGFGAGYGLFPVLSAMVADVCKPEKSTESFSLMYLVQNVGFAAGPAIGGFLFHKHLVGMFLLDGAVTVLSILVVALFAEDHYDPARNALAPSFEGRLHSGSTIRLLYARRPLFIFVCSMLVISMCYQMLNFNLSLQMSDLFGAADGSRYSGLIWTVNGIVVILLTPLIVTVTKRRHQFLNMTAALLFYAVGFGMYGFVKSVWLFFASTVIWTVGEIMINTGSAAFIAANSPATHVARFQSTLETATAAGKTFSPVLYGALLNVISYEGSWRMNACICIAISIFLAAMYRRYAVPQGGSHE